MQTIMILVDYDNVDLRHKVAGPVNLAKVLIAALPSELLSRYNSIKVRMYGGWRIHSTFTTSAQRLIPIIRSDSPTIAKFRHEEKDYNLRLIVELADKPIGTTLPLEETLVKDRNLRKFRSLAQPWNGCQDSSSCGFSASAQLSYSSTCGKNNCRVTLGTTLVRDEQKMVDTLIVADVAYQAFVLNAKDIVVVSSDTDMWPGIILALRSGCSIIHVHTQTGWRTQKHLMNTITGQLTKFYNQLSI